MNPIEKNISVIDENGKRYEATYPKRAKGLVKKGRARFVNENTICLACPPDKKENTKMYNNLDFVEKTKIETSMPTVQYILEQMAAIQKDNAHIFEALNALTAIPQNGNGDPYSPEDVTGKAKAESIADVVKCRETTNQKLMAFYEKVYDDLKPVSSEHASKVFQSVESMPDDRIRKIVNDSYNRVINNSLNNAINKAIDESINQSIQDSITKDVLGEAYNEN